MFEERNRQRWTETAIIFAAWTVFGLITAAQLRMQLEVLGRSISQRDALLQGLAESYLSALTTVAVFWLARRFPLERDRLRSSVPVHVVAAFALSLVRVIVVVEASQHVVWMGERTFPRQFSGRFHTYLLYYVLLLGIAQALHYYARYRERERTAERLAAGLTDARLQALKMQLQPHFLFNTLNAISALIPAEAKPAKRMVARLGDLLRIALEHEETQEVTLREELAFLQPYLEIEQARLDDRLTVVMSIPPDTLDVRVPHLILQPLVENAIRHGIATRIEPGKVEISAAREDNRFLTLEVRDDGRGLENNDQFSARKGIGLTNIQSRLEQLYKREHRFAIANHPEGGAVVRISIPLHRAVKPA